MKCLFDTKFDLVISLGENCGGALHMRRSGLRQASYPLDWLAGSTFEKRVQLLLNRFSGFLEPENLRISGNNDFHAYVDDAETGFSFVHDFEQGVPLEKALPPVKEKYNRRIARLYRDVAEKQNVLFIWFGMFSQVSPQALLNAQAELSRFFHKDVYLLAFQNNNKSAELSKAPRCERLSPYLLRYELDFHTERHLMGDKKTFSRILSQVAFRGKWKNLLRQAINRIVLGLIPFKSLRDAKRTRSLWGR